MTGDIRNEYIKRLKERLREKPDSRLFLSLAEELKKDDKLNEAIDILINGIRKVPDFDAARLTLGRWYLESNMLSEAKKEFSEVLKHSPDNIFAIRWINEINSQHGGIESSSADSQPYAQLLEAEKLIETGRYQAAMGIYNAILMSNPEYIKALQKREELISLMNITGRGKEQVLHRLNTFLNAIRARFAEKPAAKDNNSVINRLNKFLEAVKTRFAASPI
jgi:tetratricopeptide (TPR) repeat protein